MPIKCGEPEGAFHIAGDRVVFIIEIIVCLQCERTPSSPPKFDLVVRQRLPSFVRAVSLSVECQIHEYMDR